MKPRLDEFEQMLAVARHRNFRAAAAELGISRSALSHAIAGLEERLGVRLFHRTTRSVSLTDAGTQLLADIAPALSTIRNAVERVGDLRATPSGTLRLNMAQGAAIQIVSPLILEYCRRYPDMHVEIVTDDALIDIVRDGFDAGVRPAEAVPQDMIAVPLGPEQRMIVVGAPELLARGPEIRSPIDLLAHSCVRFRMANGRIWDWEFERRGETTTVEVRGPLTLDEMSIVVAVARAGAAFAYVSRWAVADDLAAGRLVQLLDEWTPPYEGLCLYYSHRRHLPAGMRAFVNLVRENAGVGG
jgi:DNA-binding transcriptional LysR family regulator